MMHFYNLLSYVIVYDRYMAYAVNYSVFVGPHILFVIVFV